jgi:predicted metalloprotease with PDZ domain
MSKPARAFYFVFIALFQILQIFTNASGQAIETTITIDSKSPAMASVIGRQNDGQAYTNWRNFSFIRTVADSEDLARRVSDVMFFGKDGKDLTSKKLIDGEYLAENDIRSWRYKIDLKVPDAKNAVAHTSWITNDRGILMLSDILPLAGQVKNQAVAVRFELPDGWNVLSTERMNDRGVFQTSNAGKAVFYIGNDWRERKIATGSFDLRLVISGEWLFTDEEAAETALGIFAEYRKLFGFDPAANATIAIAKFPVATHPGSWEAETRGRNVTVISSDMAFKTQSLQRLHEQLRHEVFHLWLPNGVNLSGKYDWFYEGFALYQSLKTGVELNQIRFEDFLDTLSRAHNIDSMQTQPLSLIEASQNRWKGANTQVYARGMLVAFICDLSLLQSSKGKSTVGDIYRKLYAAHKPPNPASDANTAIKKVFASYPQLASVVADYIEGSQKIDWQARLEWAGIENEPGGSRTNLRVKTKLSSRQKALLNKLGYNNWRKLTRKS